MFFFYFKWKNNLKQSLAKSISKLEKKCLQKHLPLKKCCWAVGRLTWTMVNGIISQPEPFLICFVLPDICGLTACLRVQGDHCRGKRMQYTTFPRRWISCEKLIHARYFQQLGKITFMRQAMKKQDFQSANIFFHFPCFSMIT